APPVGVPEQERKPLGGERVGGSEPAHHSERKRRNPEAAHDSAKRDPAARELECASESQVWQQIRRLLVDLHRDATADGGGVDVAAKIVAILLANDGVVEIDEPETRLG